MQSTAQPFLIDWLCFSETFLHVFRTSFIILAHIFWLVLSVYFKPQNPIVHLAVWKSHVSFFLMAIRDTPCLFSSGGQPDGSLLAGWMVKSPVSTFMGTPGPATTCNLPSIMLVKESLRSERGDERWAIKHLIFLFLSYKCVNIYSF